MLQGEIKYILFQQSIEHSLLHSMTTFYVTEQVLTNTKESKLFLLSYQITVV